jgi:alcohol dehydrogenase class IV
MDVPSFEPKCAASCSNGLFPDITQTDLTKIMSLSSCSHKRQNAGRNNLAIISYLTTVRLDLGARKYLSEDLKAAGISRPLLVTDKGIVAAGLLDDVCRAGGLAHGVPVFDGTPANPTEEAAYSALALYQSEDCDGMIALGGGSAMDLAKAVAVLATHTGELQSFAVVNGGLARITAATAPVLAMPTTAGTGSEVGRGAIISFKDGRKLGLISPYLIPKRAICDPELTLGLPPLLTAATGMDAISHCIECFTSPVDNPVAAAIAIDGLERAIKALPRAVANGSDIEARREMMVAAMEGALAFQKGLGAVHALSHPLGGYRDLKLHHGTLNAVLLPPVLRFNEPVCGKTYPRLRQAVGLAEGGDFAGFMADFAKNLGIPMSLGALGVRESLLPEIAKAALLDHTHATNARLATEADYLAMLREAY